MLLQISFIEKNKGTKVSRGSSIHLFPTSDLSVFTLNHPSIHPPMYAFKKYLLSISYVPDTGDSVENKTWGSFVPESYTLAWQTVIEQIIASSQCYKGSNNFLQTHKILLVLNNNFQLVKKRTEGKWSRENGKTLKEGKNNQRPETQYLWATEKEEGRDKKWSWVC